MGTVPVCSWLAAAVGKAPSEPPQPFQKDHVAGHRPVSARNLRYTSMFVSGSIDTPSAILRVFELGVCVAERRVGVSATGSVAGEAAGPPIVAL